MTTDAVEEVDVTAGSDTVRLPDGDSHQHAEDVVAAIHEDAERIRRRAVDEAFGKLDARDDLDDVRRDVIEGMADAIVDQLLAAPTTSVHEADDRSTLDTAVQLFDLEVEVDADETHADGSYRPEVSGGGD
jgi:glutamyl-tRNA reductase